MTAIEERVAFLEGRMDEQSHRIDGIREAIASLEQRMDARFEAIDRRFEMIEQKFTLLDAKIDNRFLWLVGTQVTTLVAIVAALVAR
jgi:predicted  nucleic acid-binding Zn-ribbon protein